MKREFTELVNDGMAGIATALISDYYVMILSQQVNHSSFAFIAPVNADY